MPKTRPAYPAEFKEKVVALVRAGRKPREIAAEFSIAEQSVRTWVKRADLDDGRRHDGLASDERDELRRLRKEVRQLKMEREILSKAAAWFARETKKVPSEPSDS